MAAERDYDIHVETRHAHTFKVRGRSGQEAAMRAGALMTLDGFLDSEQVTKTQIDIRMSQPKLAAVDPEPTLDLADTDAK